MRREACSTHCQVPAAASACRKHVDMTNAACQQSARQRRLHSYLSCGQPELKPLMLTCCNYTHVHLGVQRLTWQLSPAGSPLRLLLSPAIAEGNLFHMVPAGDAAHVSQCTPLAAIRTGGLPALRAAPCASACCLPRHGLEATPIRRQTPRLGCLLWQRILAAI